MEKINGYISIARKAGLCIVGQDEILGYDKKLYLILLDKSAGNALVRQAKHMAEERKIALVEIENLSQITKIENCKIVAIKNKAISENIIKVIKGEVSGNSTVKFT